MECCEHAVLKWTYSLHLSFLTGKTNIFVFYLKRHCLSGFFFWLHLLFEMAVDICSSYSCLKTFFFFVIVHSQCSSFCLFFFIIIIYITGNSSQAGIVRKKKNGYLLALRHYWSPSTCTCSMNIWYLFRCTCTFISSHFVRERMGFWCLPVCFFLCTPCHSIFVLSPVFQ